MINLFSTFVATIVTVPILVIFTVYWISRIVTKNKKKSLHLSVDISTLFFIIAVHFSIMVIWEKSVLWIILLLLIFIASIFVFLQWKINNEIIFKKVWKGFWRFNFLLFSFSYFSLIIFGLIQRLNNL